MGRESIYHCQGDPFDVLFVLDHCGKLGFSINEYNKSVNKPYKWKLMAITYLMKSEESRDDTKSVHIPLLLPRCDSGCVQ